MPSDFRTLAGAAESRRSSTRSVPSRIGFAASVMVSAPMRDGSGESTERATSWRMIERHSRSARSAPTPKVGSWSWSQLATLSVRLPSSTSITWPAPKRWPVRITAESTFCAGTVASHISGGFRQVSQLPQSPDSSSKYASSRRRRHVAASA